MALLRQPQKKRKKGTDRGGEHDLLLLSTHHDFLITMSAVMALAVIACLATSADRDILSPDHNAVTGVSPCLVLVTYMHVEVGNLCHGPC